MPSYVHTYIGIVYCNCTILSEKLHRGIDGVYISTTRVSFEITLVILLQAKPKWFSIYWRTIASANSQCYASPEKNIIIILYVDIIGIRTSMRASLNNVGDMMLL